MGETQLDLGLCPRCKGNKSIFSPSVAAKYGTEAGWSKCHKCGGTGRMLRLFRSYWPGEFIVLGDVNTGQSVKIEYPEFDMDGITPDGFNGTIAIDAYGNYHARVPPGLRAFGYVYPTWVEIVEEFDPEDPTVLRITSERWEL